MPYLQKNNISAFFRTNCKRQLRLNLSPENRVYNHEREAQGMPPKQIPRPGLQHMTTAGREWEVEKFSDIQDTYGETRIIGNSSVNSEGKTVYFRMPLEVALSNTVPNTFLIECEFDIRASSTFERNLNIGHLRNNYNLNYANLRPDIVQVLDPMTFTSYVESAGTERPLPTGDTRLQLRVIDIKHTSEPSNSYFAEVTYYMIALAGWLADIGLDESFVVVSGGIWPGSHDASNLRKIHQEGIRTGRTVPLIELNSALNKDIEENPFGVFSTRILRFLTEEIGEVLSNRWDSFPLHVTPKCSGCSYLGNQWVKEGYQHEDHCLPTSRRQNDLSLIPELSKGAVNALRNNRIIDIPFLAEVSPTDNALDSHQTLKAKRMIIPSRAQSLISSSITLPSGGTSSELPKWADLSIYVSVDFDISSGITSAFGLKAFWIEPVPFGQTNKERQNRSWPDSGNAYVFMVEDRDLLVERRALLDFLTAIRQVQNGARDLNPDSTIQVYIWDEIQLSHLQRIIGRHLPVILSNPNISDLTWLFPPEEVLPNHELQRRSPLTVLKGVITSLTALPIPYYYSLLETARIYHPEGGNASFFSVHPLFEDKLSDQIPSERAHEIWSRPSNWVEQMNLYIDTVKKRLRAMEAVTRKIQTDLRRQLLEVAPQILPASPRVRGAMSLDGELWYSFSKLNARIQETEIFAIRSMAIEEREAKFHSAKLNRRLAGTEEINILNRFDLTPLPNRRVYELGSNSRAVKMKEGDFLFALSPNFDGTFLNRDFRRFTQNRINIPGNAVFHWRMENATSVSIRAIDRENGYLVIDVNLYEGRDIIQELEDKRIADFTENVSIDPISKDFFTKKLEASLKSIGNPSVARSRMAVIQALGLGNRNPRETAHTPAADFLWNAEEMDVSPSLVPAGAALSMQNITEVKQTLRGYGVDLTSTQWDAWEKALTKRLQLIWGPPGTGKSRTLRAIIMGAILAAHLAEKPLRILVSASTYTAIDNVLLDSCSEIQNNLSFIPVQTARLRSAFSSLPTGAEENLNFLDIEVDHNSPTLQDFLTNLRNADGIYLVGATPDQVYNLIKKRQRFIQEELFDLILIDEASQMDVSHAVLPLCTLAEGGSLILAGDPKQLAPIHHAEAPLELEDFVGNIYNYMKEFYNVSDIMLDVNYRSNKKIVELGYEAGYNRSLTAYSPDLKLSLTSPLDEVEPANWPGDLHWTRKYSELMDPNKSLVSFVYPDGKSSQWNDFEVETVAGLIKAVYGKVSKRLENELDINGNVLTSSNESYTADDFWRHGIGVVTPHRAQQSKLVTRLQELFGPNVSNLSIIREAVDTVERFQGQQRDIIITSFALGDPDLISDEEEFLMNLNRFNVIASRARAKLVVLVSQEIIDHLASDIEVLRDSRLLKVFAESYCTNRSDCQLAYIDENAELVDVNGIIRYC
ncbi:DEAD/DEAH box helicase [Peribacillus frigoritolerans]|uniref:DEAD/DEAH box helicase n=1 Tax=Peribacillus frigoritolerans TaxID=450367 RepID=UPI00107152C6|nr:AAA domain-containing protein [Peribacillus frigoritolerans]TFH59647.1 hypothetical protein E4J71_19715 [Peribacillus frigoritolerans]